MLLTEEIIRIRNTRRVDVERPEMISQEKWSRNWSWLLVFCFIVITLGIFNSERQRQATVQHINQMPSQQAKQPQSQIEEQQTYFVITEQGNNLYVRKTAGRTNKTADDIITKIPRGTEVEVLNKHNRLRFS